MNSVSLNSTFLHHRSFLEYHKNCFTDHSLLLFNNQKLIALFPANESGGVIYSHQGLTYGGLLVNKSFRPDWVGECWRVITNYYASQGFRKLIYKPVPAYYHSLHHDLMQDIMHPPFGELLDEGQSAVIDLKQPAKLQYRRARMIKKAEKAGLIFTESADWIGFWNLLSANLLYRYNASPVHTVQEIRLLKSRFSSQIRLYVAQSEERILAGVVVFETNLTVHTQYLANSAEGRKLGALDWVVINLMKKYKRSHQYLSLGTVSDVKGEYRINKGLKDWKDGFGSTDFPHYVYKIKL